MRALFVSFIINNRNGFLVLMIFAKLTKPAGEKAASQSRLVRRLIALTLFL